MAEKNSQEIEAYPLVLLSTEKDEYQFATVRIVLESNELLYNVEHINLESEEKKIFYKVLDLLKFADAEGNLKKADKKHTMTFIANILAGVAKEMKQGLSNYEELKLAYLIYRDYAGFGKIDGIISDKNIKYIFCERAGLPVYVYHKNPRYGFIKTNIKFESMHEFNNTINNLKLKSRILRESPDFLGVLGENKIVSISDAHNEFSISMVSKMPVVPKDLVKLDVVNINTMHYLNKIIKRMGSILIIGGNDFQRTEVLNALSFLVKHDTKTVSFEQYPKLVLPQAKWYQKVLCAYRKKHVAVINDYLRYKPQFVIADGIQEIANVVKNIKNKCQTFITMESQSLDEAMSKLDKILPTPAIAYIDLVLVLRERTDGWPRIEEVYEIHDYDFKLKKLKITPVFFWNKMSKKMMVGKSRLLK